MGSEQRRDVRKRTFLRGQIIFNNASSTMDCLVRDISAIGARLEVSETVGLPEVFDLYIQQKDATYRSTLRWRRENSVGVTFEQTNERPATEPAANDGSLAALLRRISELEGENAALRSLVNQMSRPAGAA